MEEEVEPEVEPVPEDEAESSVPEADNPEESPASLMMQARSAASSIPPRRRAASERVTQEWHLGLQETIWIPQEKANLSARPTHQRGQRTELGKEGRR